MIIDKIERKIKSITCTTNCISDYYSGAALFRSTNPTILNYSYKVCVIMHEK
jgi:hypothetical protein